MKTRIQITVEEELKKTLDEVAKRKGLRGGSLARIILIDWLNTKNNDDWFTERKNELHQ